MGTTPKFGITYPDPSSAPDGPGGIYGVAIGIDNALSQAGLSSSNCVLATGVSYDLSPGVCDLITFGPLRIVHFSLFASAGIAVGATWATLAAGHRPANLIHTGANVYDGSVGATGSVAINASGGIVLETWTPDSSSDGKANAIRGTLTYWATS